MMSDDDSCIVFVGIYMVNATKLDIYLQLRERACEKKTADRRPAPRRMARRCMDDQRGRSLVSEAS